MDQNSNVVVLKSTYILDNFGDSAGKICSEGLYVTFERKTENKNGFNVFGWGTCTDSDNIY